MYSFTTVPLRNEELPHLKDELRRRNASVTGKIADLIERLEAYDRNQNFGADLDITEDAIYQYPPNNTFKDMNADSSLPNINQQEIQEYFERFNTQPKGQSLYESRHLVTARFSSDGVFTYIRGECKASMKRVAYVVNVKLNQDGAVEEAHCECAAGSGTQAHCKHVSVLLLGTHDMVQKKNIILHLTSTETLMTFKKPRKVFYNSPIAAQSLSNKRQKSCNYEPLHEIDIIGSYGDFVRNLAIGYGQSTMPILQTFEPANPYAIDWDHYSCLKRTPHDLLLDELLLNNITENQILSIEENTRAQSDSPLWLKMRSHRITASMFYVECHSKTGVKHLVNKILYPKPIHTRSVVHGKINESISINKYEQLYGLTVTKCGLFISLENPFLAASPDGLIGDDTVIEVKCPYSSRYSMICPVTVPYLEIRNGDLHLKKNHPYYSQIQGQLYCTGRNFCNFIVYTFCDIKTIFINRDNSFINEMLINLINFYNHQLQPAIINKYVYKNYDSLIKKQQ